MSMHRVTTTAISTGGFTNSTWNTITCSSVVAVPSGATAAIVVYENTSAGAVTMGLRTTGKTAAILNTSIAARGSSCVIVPLASGQVDVYSSAWASSTFAIVGYLSSAWTFYDIDSGSPKLLTSTSGSTTNRDAGAVDASIPANGTLLMLNFAGAWQPTSAGSLAPNATGSYSSSNGMFLKLDGSKTVDIKTSADNTILGYVGTGVNWQSWLTTELTDGTMTKDATFRDGPNTYAGKSFVYFAPSGDANARGFATRGDGDSIPAHAGGLSNGGNYVGKLTPLTAGVYEYAAENTTQYDYYALATFDEAGSGASAVKGRNLLLGVG